MAYALRGNYTNTPLLTEADLMYIAGLFDGEGTAGVYRRRHPHTTKSGELKRYDTLAPGVRVGMADANPIRFLHLCFNGGFYKELRSGGKAHKAHYKPIYCWTLSSRQALAFAKLLMPYVKNDAKVAQLQSVIDHYERMDTASTSHGSESIGVGDVAKENTLCQT